MLSRVNIFVNFLCYSAFACLVTTAAITPCASVLGAEGAFTVIHSSPIFQDITRISFLATGPSGEPWIHFSTLESYHRNTNGDRFLMVSVPLGSATAQSRVIEGSTEGRSWGYCDSLQSFVIGTSLDPQIFLFNPKTREMKNVFKGPPAGMWIHRLAVDGKYAYTIFSTPLPSVAGFEGITQVDLETGGYEIIPFDTPSPQGYGGVETVDPTGRIWFYRSFPLKKMWFDRKGGMRARSLTGWESWTVEDWDVWKGRYYVLLANTQGKYKKELIDLQTLQVQPVISPDESTDDHLFRRCVRISLPQNREGLYYDPTSHSFFKRRNDFLTPLGKVDLGKWRLSGFANEPQESAIDWIHPLYGEVEVLGLSPHRELVVWLRGRKTYSLVKFDTDELPFKQIKVQNLSPSNVTTLQLAGNGKLYGGGYLTMCHLFEFDPTAERTRLLYSALPNTEGQINSLFTGWDGKIYGAGYPDSILFRFDPTHPWNPGSSLRNNPVNMGPMGHYRQTRAFRGIQDLDGTVWYQSVSDFALPIAHALARADFKTKTMQVKTDLADGFPEVEDLSVFDANHLILVGKSGNQHGLFLLDQKSFKVVRHVPLKGAGGLLLHRNPKEWGRVRPLFVQKGTVYEVNKDLTLSLVHRSIKPVVRVVPWDADSVVLVGKTHIEKLDLRFGHPTLWWNKEDVPGQAVFQELTWTPVVAFQGALYLADREKLLKFTPPAGD